MCSDCQCGSHGTAHDTERQHTVQHVEIQGVRGSDAGPGAAASDQAAPLVVSGMTCQHCVASVTEEVGEIAGVQSVSVDLDSGRLELVTEGPVDRELVAAAVREAGYTLA